MVDVICSVAEETWERFVVVSSIPAATEVMLELISSAAADTEWALSELLREPDVISVEVASSSVEDEAKTWIPPVISWIMRRRATIIFCMLRPIFPISSPRSKFSRETSLVTSPQAI